MLFNAREISKIPIDGEEDIRGKTITIDVYAHGIQVDHLKGTNQTTTDPLEIWKMISSRPNNVRMLLKIIRIVYHAVATAITIIGFTVILLFLVGIGPYAVQTGSMEPEIMTGSLCFVNQNVSFSEIHGVILVAFRLDGLVCLFTHRVKRSS